MKKAKKTAMVISVSQEIKTKIQNAARQNYRTVSSFIEWYFTKIYQEKAEAKNDAKITN